MNHQLPKTGEGLHGENLSGPAAPPSIGTSTADSPLEESLPIYVTQQESAAKSREFWEPVWGNVANDHD